MIELAIFCTAATAGYLTHEATHAAAAYIVGARDIEFVLRDTPVVATPGIQWSATSRHHDRIIRHAPYITTAALYAALTALSWTPELGSHSWWVFAGFTVTLAIPSPNDFTSHHEFKEITSI